MLERHLPADFLNIPKKGFGIPLAEWLRKPNMRDWAEHLFSKPILSDVGLLNESLIKIMWSEHISGRVDHSHKLWSILIFQSWVEKNFEAI